MSAGVVAGLAILLTGQWWIDPLVRFAIVAMIAWGTWGLAKGNLRTGLLAVPASIDVEDLHRHLAELEGVKAVHDLHIWPMSTTETALTAHLVMLGAPCSNGLLREIGQSFVEKVGVGHSTLQVECGTDSDPCGTGC